MMKGMISLDQNAMYKISYGLYVMTAREGGKDNGCIVNTVEQVTVTPNRIAVAVNKENLTHNMVINTGFFNISILSQGAPFSVFKNFGYQSGRTADKFKDIPFARAENGIAYLTAHSCAVLCAKVASTVNLGTHTLFIADVTDARVLCDEEPVTYAFYQSSIKPAPPAPAKPGYRCKICGYVYEGDPLPDDFICPICKHGAADFEKVE